MIMNDQRDEGSRTQWLEDGRWDAAKYQWSVSLSTFLGKKPSRWHLGGRAWLVDMDFSDVEMG